MKLVIDEIESDALRRYLLDNDARLVSSRIAATEVLRVQLRLATTVDAHSTQWLRDTSFRELTPDLGRAAGTLEPARLRSLDAIHLATALELRDEIDAFLTYDDRLASAARQHGLRVFAPT